MSLMGATDFAAAFDKLHYFAADARDKGSTYERLVKRHVGLESKYADRFSDACPSRDWPVHNGHATQQLTTTATTTLHSTYRLNSQAWTAAPTSPHQSTTGEHS
ncbi:hypothetical protein GCM10028789_06940 [Sinomonas halotolerans]